MEGGESVAAGQKPDPEIPGQSTDREVERNIPAGDSTEDGDYCRICRGEATDELPLFYPCKCSGSIRFVHQDCLMEWLLHSQKKYCELCKATFRFTKLYDHRMPQTLPLWIFLRQLCIRTVQNAFRWTRYILVSLVWLAWLPWSIRQVWRALFWFADGSWGSVDAPPPNDQDLTSTATPNITTDSVSFPLVPAQASGFLASIPYRESLLSSFVKILSSNSLLFRFFRLSNSTVSHWLIGLVDDKITTRKSSPAIPDRQPSFLSEVRYLKYLTPYHDINGWVVEVLEGQLVCLLVVTGFVLVFLIREWVINQQPAPNVPNGHHVEAERPAAAEDAALRGPIPHHRRRPTDEEREETIRRIAVPAPSRRLAPPDTEAEDPSAVAPEATSSSPNSLQETQTPKFASSKDESGIGDYELLEDQHDTPSVSATSTRPPLEDRHALEPAARIRRTIEEHNLRRPALEWPGLESFNDLWDRAAGDPSEVLRIIRDEGRVVELGWVVAQMERLQQKHKQQPSRRHSIQAFANTTSDMDCDRRFDGREFHKATPLAPYHDSPSGTSCADKSPATFTATKRSSPQGLGLEKSPDFRAATPPIQEETYISQETGSDFLKLPAESPWEIIQHETVNEADQTLDSFDTFPEVESSDTSSGLSDVSEEASHNVSLVGAAIDWFLGVEDYEPQGERQADGVEEQIVEATTQEGRPPDDEEKAEMNQGVNPEVAEAEQDPEIMVAAMAPEIEFNAEAIEEAEELDGLLELIGMQGPLTGMVQNVILSEVLITLFLTVSIWLPYIWGRIALLLLSDPIGVLFKAPVHLLSRLADTSVDGVLLFSGVCVYTLGYCLHVLTPLISAAIPGWQLWVDPSGIRKASLSLVSVSGARMEKAIYGTVGDLKPDLPIFSILSHQALQLFQRRLFNAFEIVGRSKGILSNEVPSRLHEIFNRGTTINISYASDVPRLIGALSRQMEIISWALYDDMLKLRSLRFGVGTPRHVTSIDYNLVQWSTRDRIVAIVFGYVFLAFLGSMYIHCNRLVLGLKNSDKVEGVVAESLNQAAGVTKVILFIGVEIIAFPLYCGLLLDIASMPLFEGASLKSRLAFAADAPMTAFLVHWFFGTCYIFHLALFVKMCRQIMRTGVLHFIRDSADQSLHPIREVLERPVASQLRRIAFSVVLYGGLVIVYLGGIVRVLSKVQGMFPIYWTSNEPTLEFPIDVLYYNLLLPTLIRTVQPSERLKTIYQWCFRKCGRLLRLTNFLFKEERDDEQGRYVRRTRSSIYRQDQGHPVSSRVGEAHISSPDDSKPETYFLRDGKFVRAPGLDSVRIPKGGQVFVTVDEKTNRIDGQNDEAHGPHGKSNKEFVKVYIPPMFRARLTALLILVCAFTTVSGITFTAVPLSLGRKVIQFVTGSGQPPNDLYAFSLGLHLCGAMVYLVSHYETWRNWTADKINDYSRSTNQALPRLWHAVVYLFSLAYMAAMFSILLPLIFSILVELYFVIPLNTYFALQYTPHPPSHLSIAPTPTIHIVQTWTVGLIYLRAVLRFATNYPHPQSRVVSAINGILRKGIWRPDVKLATRAFVLPSLVFSVSMLTAPLIFGWTINLMLGEPSLRGKVYQYSYPGVLGVTLMFYCAVLLKRQIGAWRSKIRDDVYLIGERLHNFGESQRRPKKAKAKAIRDRAVSRQQHMR